MKILVTGSSGFIGRNLCETLKNIRDGKDRRPEYADLQDLTLFEFDSHSSMDELGEFCSECDFVFNLAGVNRATSDEQFKSGNHGFLQTLLGMLSDVGNKCPVLLTSSIQATLSGRFEGSKYGESKKDAEELLLNYGAESGAKVLVYRLPNVFGKWSRPNYNSAVATFCHNLTRQIPITVNDPSVELKLLYVDDLVECFLGELLQMGCGEGCYRCVSPVEEISLGELASTLVGFEDARREGLVPDAPAGTFKGKLLSTFMSFCDPAALGHHLDNHVDARGSFCELLPSVGTGQVSINITKPGQVKGNHWHHSKWEKFCVVSGCGRIDLKQACGADEDSSVYSYLVDGECPVVIDIIPGYTHNLRNVSDTDDLVTVMWANERFDETRPDTFYLEV
ncbi:MAG: SDR family oxidoreductase [Eggerthellaceae bacterium]|nr:SDR family oxidoreductase [Eggerthellaceae bacterium]